MNPVVDIPGLLPLWQRVSGGDPTIRIAIMDGPVDFSHPALRPGSGARVALAQQAAAEASLIRSEHGTHVTSVLMGAPGGPVLGVAPNCTATVFPIYRENATGELEPSSQATLALAIIQALADGADVINISSGQQTPSGQADRILADAVRRCADAGKLIVAAAGNDGCRCVQVPGALESVLAVGACDLAGSPLPFSNYGDPYLENGILAPGENVNGASPAHNVALRSGTSFATPIVTGVVALLLSYLRQSGRDANPQAVRSALLASAVPCDSAGARGELRCLIGRLNIPEALAALSGELTDDRWPSEVHSDGLRTRSHRDDEKSLRPVTPLTPAKERTMQNTPTPANVSAPLILGPDGTPLRSAAGVVPTALPSAPPAADAASGVGAVPVAIAAPSPATSVTPPLGAGAVWVPMPMSMVGGLTPGWLPAQPHDMVASAVSPAAVLPTKAPPDAARADAVPTVRTSGANCACGVRPAQAEATTQLCFPIGRLYYDFGIEARVDYFVQAIANWRDDLGDRGVPDFGRDRDRSGDLAAPYDPAIMAGYLLNLAEGETQLQPTNNLRDANAIIWLLTIDTVPLYAIKPLDVFGLAFYANLLLGLWYQEVSDQDPTASPPRSEKKALAAKETQAVTDMGRVSRVAIAGWLDTTNTTRLLNGTVVPTLSADWRGFYQWDLIAVLGPRDTWPEGLDQFLLRIYNEFRNPGISPQDRALNYSAMNAYNTRKIFKDAVEAKTRLDTVEVDRSVICRPDSDCWDVTYRFFDPMQVLTRARTVYQYTIDVNDIVPVAVGKLRQWAMY